MKIIVNMEYISPTIPDYADGATDLIEDDILEQLLVGIEQIREEYTDKYNEDCSYGYIEDIDYKIEMAARLFNEHTNNDYDSLVYSFFDGTTKAKITPRGQLSLLKERGKQLSDDPVEIDKIKKIISSAILADKQNYAFDINDYTSIVFITHISVWLKSFPCISYIEKLN